ncbi:uncharacterized protein [Prorops nasuta]|uniref:uncharacterized protein n=1 Tax=Prorops nasuta TaxID=863751 RepID=UPI0034CEEC23
MDKKKRNTNYCCVPQCSNYADTAGSLHLFPKDKRRRSQWETALKMGKPASNTMRVCSHHFLPSDYFPTTVNTIKHMLYPTAIPSLNVPARSHEISEQPIKKEEKLARSRRAENRESRKISNLNSEKARVDKLTVSDMNINKESTNITLVKLKSILSTGVQVNLADHRECRPQDNIELADFLCDNVATQKCTQVNFLPKFTERIVQPVKCSNLSNLLNNKTKLFTFTGIHSIELLNTIVSCVEDLITETTTNKMILSVKDRVILTMVKIKQNMAFAGLSILFDVNSQTCANYFRNMCPILAEVLKVMIPFPDQELIRNNLPMSFKNFKHTRIIMDCAEIPIEQSKCLKCRVLTYSQYKKTYTVKFNIGITPSGLITEISVPYGGRATDKHIVNDSSILFKMDCKDGIMVDKGYRIENECMNLYLDLIRPPFLQKQKQMSQEDCIQNAEIARARVHVEPVIQRLRQYEFLRGPISWTLMPYVEDILIIVCSLTNLGPPVINIDKFM